MPAFGKRRALGQHFLRDRKVIEQITTTALEEARKNGCRALLEIGPGKGAITLPLFELLTKDPGPIEEFTLAERDTQFVADWRSYKPSAKVKFAVKSGDFLDLPENHWMGKTPLAVVSNLPYSTGTAILTRLAEHPAEIPFMVLMFQAEVAFRLRAEPETKSWGSLSIWIQNRWDVSNLCSVPPGAFVPPPDVDSEVVVLRRREKPRIETPDPRLWESLLKAAFAHRRKMLRSGLPAGKFREALERSGLAGTKRAEALEWAEWGRLYEALLELR